MSSIINDDFKAVINEKYVDEVSREFDYDKLILIAQVGDNRGITNAGGITTPIYAGDRGANSGDWSEQGVNHLTVNSTRNRSGERAAEYEVDDQLMSDLNGKNIRFIYYYTGSFDCEAIISGDASGLYNQSAGTKYRGDVQATSIHHQKMTGTNLSNVSPASGTSNQRWYFPVEVSIDGNGDAGCVPRSSKETILDAYKKQNFRSSTNLYGGINDITDLSTAWEVGGFNRRIQDGISKSTPTTGTGALVTPVSYNTANIAAYVGNASDNALFQEMWCRTDIINQGSNGGFLSLLTQAATDLEYERLVVSLGSHGLACGSIKVYIYVEPLSTSLPTPSDTVAPTGPDLISANIENDEATLTWEESSTDYYQSFIEYKYKDIDESSFNSYKELATAIRGQTSFTSSLNDLLSIPERYGEFQFKITPVDKTGNVGTGAETPVKGQFEDISFVKSGTQIVSSGGQTLSITGIQANDLIMLSGTSDSQLVSSPTGFTELEDDDGTANPGAVVCYKIASGTSESITLPNQGGSGANQIIWAYQVFRNVSTSNPIDGSISNHNSGSSRINLPSLTTTTDNCMIVVYGMVDDDGYSSLLLPSGYTRTVMDYTGIGFNLNYATVVGGYKLEGNAGTYNPGFIQLAQNDGRDGFTIALRPKQEDFTTTLPEFSYIYWEATQSTSTSFYVYCEFDVTNSDIPTSARAYVTVDGTTPSTTNFVKEAVLVDTSTGSNASTWDSSTQLGFSTSGVAINDDVKVLIVANNSKGDENSVVVTLTITALGNNNTEYIYP